MTGPHCDHCPLRGRDCPAFTRPHRRYCELVDPANPDYNPAYVAVLTRPRGPAAPAPEPAPAPGPCRHLGRVIDSDPQCGCGVTRLCDRYVKVVGPADCAACPGREPT